MKMWRKFNFDIIMKFMRVLFMAYSHGDFFCFIPLSLGRNWSIFEAYQFKGFFFVDFRPFLLNKYNVASISLEIKKNDSMY